MDSMECACVLHPVEVSTLAAGSATIRAQAELPDQLAGLQMEIHDEADYAATNCQADIVETSVVFVDRSLLLLLESGISKGKRLDLSGFSACALSDILCPMASHLTQRSILFHVFDVALNIVIIVAIVAIIRTFIVSPFQIEGNSMISTLEDNEYIVINKFRYLFKTPERGDIVVFRPPSDLSKHYVKRVIGVPGDTVVIRDGSVYLRREGMPDTKLEEPYLSEANSGRTYRFSSAGGVSGGDTSEEAFIVPEGSYFLLGDNRQGSLDSRTFPYLGTRQSAFVPEENIKGSVWFVALPVSRIHAFEAPVYDL